MSSSNVGQLTAILVVAAAVALGVGGVLVWNAVSDTEQVVTGPAGQQLPADLPTPAGGLAAPVTAPTVDPAPGATVAPPPTGSTAVPAPAPTATPPPTVPPEPTVPASSASADIDDAVFEAALAEAATSPLVGLPGIDEIATVRLNQQLVGAGYDLTALDITIYPASSADSFVLLETDDSTPLFASEAGESFITDLVGSPIIAEYEIERLVLRHRSVDEQGPLIVTSTLLVSDFRAALAEEVDLFAVMVTQTERP